jgi:osmotically-inducible protein OsmY
MNRDYKNERWNENRDRYQQDDQYSNWQNSNSQVEDNRNRGGFMGNPGSNYASGTYSGIAYGRGLTEDNYRGYNNTGNMQGNFASNYNAAYGDQWNDYRGENRGHEDRNSASDFGYGGHYGAGGSYGSFGGPASSRINVPEQRNQGRTGAYSSDYGYQNQEKGSNRSGMERLSGGHKGKGPRGYHRSDERIQEDVNDRLSDDAYVDASDIDVKVENGTIILSGHVPDKKAKRRAEDIAESVRGVNNVENRLRIGEGIMENAAKAFTSGLGDVTVGNNSEKR